MKNYNYVGFDMKSLSTLFLCLLLLVFSCEQKEDQVAPKQNQDASLEKHLKFLEESTGTDRKDIVYDEATEVFYIDNDLFISKKAVEEHMNKKTSVSGSNQRTEQRRWHYLVSDAYVTNIKYYIQPSVPAEWRGAITGAINEWNNIGGTKLRISLVASSAQANISIDALYDNVNNWVARAQLPYADGHPGRVLTVNTFHNGMQAGHKLFAMVHEIGHNIGFLHTNQTDGTIIPGTPATDPNSVMNSFVLPWNGFTEYDRIATRTLYPGGVSGVVTLFQHCSFGGYSAGLAVGDYNLGALNSRGILNDDISSIRVAAGYQVTVYQHHDFTGASQTFIADDNCLVDNGINDWVSSVRVRQR